MSYQSISVKQAVNKINNNNNGWYLPAVQRPYVWGSRYESELFICKLFDSILRGYPIGGILVWNTQEKIPYREFMSDFYAENFSKIVDEGLFSKADKWLVYDGQQRLQTLYSCLKYTFNNRLLIFDLFFDDKETETSEETGFSFIDKDKNLENNQLKMNELFSKLYEEESKFEKKLLKRFSRIEEEKEDLFKMNFKRLWKVFVDTDKKSLTYFPIENLTEEKVNDIFQRINSGGIQLSLSDRLLSRIKEKYYTFEEDLLLESKRIYEKTGYLFSAYDMLQLIFLIVKKTIRVDPTKVKKDEVKKFYDVWLELKDPLFTFCYDYLFKQFGINNQSIIPRKNALYPLIVYFYKIYTKKFKFRNFTSSDLKMINKYFILSQINDWALQSYIDNFVDILDNKSKNKKYFEFPIVEIMQYVHKSKKRNLVIYEENFSGYTWFSLKILIPNRKYEFDPKINGRFSPEIDHIFPFDLEKKNNKYKNKLDVIWNLQPTKGEINRYKWNYLPKEFFTDKLKSNDNKIISGSKYISEYDFIFPKNKKGEINFADQIWDQPLEFINKRKKLMTKYFEEKYGLKIVKDSELKSE